MLVAAGSNAAFTRRIFLPEARPFCLKPFQVLVFGPCPSFLARLVWKITRLRYLNRHCVHMHTITKPRWSKGCASTPQMFVAADAETILEKTGSSIVDYAEGVDPIENPFRGKIPRSVAVNCTLQNFVVCRRPFSGQTDAVRQRRQYLEVRTTHDEYTSVAGDTRNA